MDRSASGGRILRPLGGNRRRGSTIRHFGPFWPLAGLLAAAFLCGGSSRADAPLLIVLRPLAILAAGYGIATLERERLRHYRQGFAFAGAVVLLTALHLMPLPPAAWHLLPGRDLVQSIDAAAGLSGTWRPLSMDPAGTLNALYALSVPLAVLVLAARLDEAEQMPMLFVVIALAGLSAMVGLLQIAGLPIQPYEHSTETPGLFGNRNHQAVLLSALPPMVAVAARHKSVTGASARLAWTVTAAVAIIIVPLIIVTGSRSGLAVGTLSLILTFALGIVGLKPDRRAPRFGLPIKLGVAAAVAALAIGLTVFAARDVAINRLASAADDLRPRLWASIVPMLPVFQPWGSGAGSFERVYQTLEPVSMLRQTDANHAHDEYLEVAFTTGVPGVLLLAWAGAFLGASLQRNGRRRRRTRLFATLGQMVLILLAFASITDYPIRTPILSALLALAMIWSSGIFPAEQGDNDR